MKKFYYVSVFVTLLLLGTLVGASDGAVGGAKNALDVCASVIIPCLFPFFVISYLINQLGISTWLGQHVQTPMSLLFGVSGTGAGVFILGILGGYPLGAAVISDLVQKGELDLKEGEKLLAFCNNSGPAFLIGAVGIGVFHSSALGLVLYGIHILAAVITGLFLSGTRYPDTKPREIFIFSTNLSTALPESIGKAALQVVQICGYVIFFGAVVGILEELGVFSAIYGSLATYSGLTLHHTKALCMGLMELGCGVGAMADAAVTPQALTICAFLTGFGGISVAMQTAGVLHGTGIRLRYHLLGRLCSSAISAFLMFTFSSIIL
ncbi:MAG: hypothetical protein J6J04_03800 [Oscillospiraceae bacterium]|nr:hypothetical protein [Oscillospiraceae bacterium]